jgi:hypothetical protein
VVANGRDGNAEGLEDVEEEDAGITVVELLVREEAAVSESGCEASASEDGFEGVAGPLREDTVDPGVSGGVEGDVEELGDLCEGLEVAGGVFCEGFEREVREPERANRDRLQGGGAEPGVGLNLRQSVGAVERG